MAYFVNHETCDCCSESGDLICCDNCPCSFHFKCLNPPITESDVPEGDWYCNRCAKGLFTYKEDNPFTPLIQRLSRMNPKLFSLPVNLLPANSEKDVDGQFCEYCVNESRAGLVRCDLCNHAYHISCLDPPLIAVPAHFECERHGTAPSFVASRMPVSFDPSIYREPNITKCDCGLNEEKVIEDIQSAFRSREKPDSSALQENGVNDEHTAAEGETADANQDMPRKEQKELDTTAKDAETLTENGTKVKDERKSNDIEADTRNKAKKRKVEKV